MDERSLKIVGVRFAKIGKIYFFDASKVSDIISGDKVIVETSRGWQIGEVVLNVKEPGQPPEGAWKQIDRRATPRDLMHKQVLQQKEDEIVEYSQKRVRELKIRDAKVVSAEISFDNSRLTVLFTSENQEKIEFKSLRPELHKLANVPNVEFKQIGPRDVAKCLGGMGACGLDKRCCSRFLTEFNSISIKMAKEQGISLTPSEITGMCGRLRCCLVYEYQFYVSARQALPKRNTMVITPNGEGKVIDLLPLKGAVLVELPEIGRKEFSKEEIEPVLPAAKDLKPNQEFLDGNVPKENNAIDFIPGNEDTRS